LFTVWSYDLDQLFTFLLKLFNKNWGYLLKLNNREAYICIYIYVKHLFTSSFTALYIDTNLTAVIFPFYCPCYNTVVNTNKG
jgi:hypothetical protein